MIATASQTKVERAPNLTEQVIALLRSKILSGNHALGSSLPSEQAMSLSFGVSRTVMREAISRLKAEGLVETRKGLGVFVVSNRSLTPFVIEGTAEDPDVVLSVLELRIGVEVESAGLAATRRDEDDIKLLRQALSDMAEAVSSGDVAAGVEADLRFHQLICATTKNHNFIKFSELINGFMKEAVLASRSKSASNAIQERVVQGEHQQIFDAIAARDAEGARSAMRMHLKGTALRKKSL